MHGVIHFKNVLDIGLLHSLMPVPFYTTVALKLNSIIDIRYSLFACQVSWVLFTNIAVVVSSYTFNSTRAGALFECGTCNR